MRRAILSIGTNSTRALVASFDNGSVTVDYSLSIGTRIGEGLRASGQLAPKPIARTIEALRLHLAALEPLAVDVLVVVATSAMRRAKNAADFAASVREVTGSTLRVLSGDEEARAAYRGALTCLPGELRGALTGVIDTGGGSTEYAFGRGSYPEQCVSCEIGAVRLTERFPELSGADGRVPVSTLKQAQSVARDLLKPIAAFPKVDRLMVVGGSATAMAALVAGTLDPVLSRELSQQELRATIDQLAHRPLDERMKLPGMRAQRADILLAGGLILDAAFEQLGHTTALTTSADLPLGVLLLDAEESGPLGTQESQLEGPEHDRS